MSVTDGSGSKYESGEESEEEDISTFVCRSKKVYEAMMFKNGTRSWHTEAEIF
jgi:hypothetical protein